MAHGEIRGLLLTKTIIVMITKYKSSQLPEILRDMASYVENIEEDCERDYYFEYIVGTGLFHDAIGKVIDTGDNEVTITTDY